MWKRQPDLNELNRKSEGNLVAHLGIRFTEIGEDFLEAEMPVDDRTRQPFGLLHGGASVVLAETLGSMASWLAAEDGKTVVGTDINATHHRAVYEGKVRGICKPLQLGRTQHCWEIAILDEQGKRCCTARLTTRVLG